MAESNPTNLPKLELMNHKLDSLQDLCLDQNFGRSKKVFFFIMPMVFDKISVYRNICNIRL